MKIVVCSSSIAAKKSVKAFVVSAFGVSFEDDPPGVAAAGAAAEVDDACVGSNAWVVNLDGSC